MKIQSKIINGDQRLTNLTQIAQPVTELFYLSNDLDSLLGMPMVAIVGSRKVTAYGREATIKLAMELARAGVVIVSGLALGVDSIAHQAALDAGGKTIAVLPGSLEKIYPPSHRNLAMNILRSGGALLSEYSSPNESPMKYQFIARNRIIAALSKGVVITESAAKGGSLHTAEFALELGIDVFAVPGNITSATSEGVNNLIKHGAALVTSAQDILESLDISPQILNSHHAANEQEALVLEALQNGLVNLNELIITTKIDPKTLLQTISQMEITGIISSDTNSNWFIN